MTLQGYTIPRTATGKASLVPPPPWHYVGDFLVVDYWADPDAVRALLPPGLDPHPDTGRCAAVFADWQSCSDTGDELIDPIRSHYREFFIVVNALLDGEEVTTCPFIWVDQDFALARGWIQGFPKKLGSIWMTRPVTVGRAGPRLEAGAVFGATLQANDRRLAEARFTITERAETGGFVNALPMLHSRWMPAIDGTGDALDELVTMRSRDVELGPVFRGTFELTLHEAPGEELADLAPVEPIAGYWRQVGATFAGGEQL